MANTITVGEKYYEVTYEVVPGFHFASLPIPRILQHEFVYMYGEQAQLASKTLWSYAYIGREHEIDTDLVYFSVNKISYMHEIKRRFYRHTVEDALNLAIEELNESRKKAHITANGRMSEMIEIRCGECMRMLEAGMAWAKHISEQELVHD